MMPLITIIGGGFSGAMVAINLLKLSTTPLVIQLVERSSKIGQGIAYSTDCDWHLLNTPVGKMSAFPNQPNHFLSWLQERGHSVKADDFVPRKLYGEYIRSLLKDAVISGSKLVRFVRITSEVIAVSHNSIGTNVHLASGKVLLCDRLVLANGHLPSLNPPVANPSFYKSKRYLNSGWNNPCLSSIACNDSVLIIGSGLTAIDVVVYLYKQGHQGKIYLVSRRGLLPQSHINSEPYPCFVDGVAMSESLSQLLRRVRLEIKAAKSQGYPPQAVIDSFRSQNQALWHRLSLSEKRRFLRHLRPYWDIHRHRLAQEIASLVNNMLDSGQLIVHKGRIQGYEEDKEGVNVIIRSRGSECFQTLRANVVINCTGSNENYKQNLDPLRSNLLNQGLVKLDPLGLGLEVTNKGMLIDAKGDVVPWLYALGSLCKGSLWETTAVPEIRQQACIIALEIIKSIGSNQQQTISLKRQKLVNKL